MLTGTSVSGYELYFLVPTIYGLSVIISGKMDFLNYHLVGAFILQWSMFVRYAITPLIGHLGNYYSIRGTSVSSKQIQLAIVLTLYEMIVILIVCSYCNRKYTNSRNVGHPSDQVSESEKKPLQGVFFHILIIILGIAAVLYQPLAIADQRFLFDSSDLATTIVIDVPNAGIYRTAFNFARYSAVLLIINCFYKRNLRYKSNFNLVFPTIAILVNALFNSNLSRIGLLVPVVTFLTIELMLFTDKVQRRTLLIGMGSIIVVALLFSSFVKFFGEGRGDVNNASSLEWWADTMNAYFMGVKEIALGIKANSTIQDVYGINRIPLLFNDVFSNVIGLSNFTNSSINSTTLYNYAYFGSSISTSQICPNICEGLYYFGWVFAPLWTAIFIRLTYWFSERVLVQNSVDMMFVYTISAVYCGMSLMINSSMIIYAIVNISLLYYILSYLNKITVLRGK